MEHYEEQLDTMQAMLEDVLENQNILQRTLGEMHEKMQLLESQLGIAAPEDEYALEEAVDNLYDTACARAETGVHMSVPYLIRELQTTAAVAHELMERLRIDGLLDTGNTEDSEEDGTDVFTTIDLREINGTSDGAAESTDTAVYEAARSYVVTEQKCSQAALMNALGITQAAARTLLSELETAGVVSAPQGRKGRTVLVTE